MSLPTWGSVMILKASAENGSLSLALRSRDSSPLEFVPVIGGQIHRRGRYMTMASSSGWTPLFLNARAVEHRDDLAGDGRLANRGAQLVDADLLVTHELFEQILVDARDRLDQFGAVLLRLVEEIGRDLLHLPLRAELLVLPDERVHGDEVDHALVVTLGADRQLHDRDRAIEPIADGVDAPRRSSRRGGPSC